MSLLKSTVKMVPYHFVNWSFHQFAILSTNVSTCVLFHQPCKKLYHWYSLTLIALAPRHLQNDTQHNDIQHNNENATLSITTLNIMMLSRIIFSMTALIIMMLMLSRMILDTKSCYL